MRILFVGSHRADKQFSILGFEHALERELGSRCPFETVYPGMGGQTKRMSKWARYAEKYIAFPRVLRSRAKDADIVHFCEKGSAINLPHVRDKVTLVTVHDFLAVQAAQGDFPGWTVGWSGRKFQRQIVRAVTGAKALACVSDTTRAAQRHFLPNFKGQVRTILNSMYKDFKRAGEKEIRDRLTGPYMPPFTNFFFHIGGNKPYKNRIGALNLFSQIKSNDPSLEWGLVMAGGPKTEELANFEQSAGLAGSVHWAVEPSDEQVEAYYSLAGALLFPSLAEGFGLPMIEAQSCGCPVFASNRGPMTEIGAGSAVYFDPTDPSDGASQVLAHMDNLGELTRLGYENVKRFAPKLMGDAYLDYYKDLMSRS